MKNKEKFHDEIFEIACSGSGISVKNNKPVSCNILGCDNCQFYDADDCNKTFAKWCEKEYVEPEPEVDWSKVPVDTKVYVKESEDQTWFERHFARYKHGKVYVFLAGRTSWTESNTIGYEYVKLAEPLPEEKSKSAMELLAESYYANGCEAIKDDVFEEMINSCPKDHGYVNVVKCDVGENDAKLADCYKCWTLPQPDKMEG